MAKSKLVEELETQRETLLEEKGKLTLRLREINSELDLVDKYLQLKGPVTIEVKTSSHQVKAGSPYAKITAAVAKLGGSGTREEIQEALEKHVKCSAKEAKNLCKNHLSTMVKNGDLLADDSGPLRLYKLP